MHTQQSGTEGFVGFKIKNPGPGWVFINMGSMWEALAGIVSSCSACVFGYPD